MMAIGQLPAATPTVRPKRLKKVEPERDAPRAR